MNGIPESLSASLLFGNDPGAGFDHFLLRRSAKSFDSGECESTECDKRAQRGVALFFKEPKYEAKGTLRYDERNGASRELDQCSRGRLKKKILLVEVL